MCGEVWAGRPAVREAPQLASPTTARPPPLRTMAGSSSLEAVRRKIRSLQEQADAAEERAGSLQRELDYERKLRETVRDPPIDPPNPPRGASSPVGPTAPQSLWTPPVPAPTPRSAPGLLASGSA